MNRKEMEALCIDDAGCLIWQGGCCSQHPARKHEGKMQLVRRVLREKEHGPIPKGMVLRVTCGNTRCLTAEHVKLMTRGAMAKSLGGAVMGGRVRTVAIAKAWHSRPDTVLSWPLVNELRASTETGAQLARRTGLSKSIISKVRLHRTWKVYSSPFAGLGARA